MGHGDTRPTDTRKGTGARGEAMARAYLEGRGYRFVTANWRAGRYGELDLIMQDGETLVFIEVKTKRFQMDLEMISSAKQQQLARMAELYLQATPAYAAQPCRLEAVFICLRTGEVVCLPVEAMD